MNPRPDENSEGGIVVEMKLKELEQKTAEVTTEWSIVPGRGGHPTLVYFCQTKHHLSSTTVGFCLLDKSDCLLLNVLCRPLFSQVELLLLSIGISKD